MIPANCILPIDSQLLCSNKQYSHRSPSFSISLIVMRKICLFELPQFDGKHNFKMRLHFVRIFINNSIASWMNATWNLSVFIHCKIGLWLCVLDVLCCAQKRLFDTLDSWYMPIGIVPNRGDHIDACAALNNVGRTESSNQKQHKGACSVFCLRGNDSRSSSILSAYLEWLIWEISSFRTVKLCILARIIWCAILLD